jgi:hypothetical protein
MQLPFKVVLLPADQDVHQAQGRQSLRLYMQEGRANWPIFRAGAHQVREVLGCLQVERQEQLSFWHQDLLSSNTCGLEDFLDFSYTIAQSSLDH